MTGWFAADALVMQLWVEVRVRLATRLGVAVEEIGGFMVRFWR